MLPSELENLSRGSIKLIHAGKKTTTCIGLQVEQIFSVKYLIYIFFQFWT